MQRRMGAHPTEAPGPVDPRDHAGARSRQAPALRRHMQDRSPVGVVDRIDDRNARSVIENQDPLIAGLPAPLRIEYGPVELYAPLVGGEDFRRRLAQVCVVSKEGLGHRMRTSGARALASSQAGTARSLERRKAGLKSLEA